MSWDQNPNLPNNQQERHSLKRKKNGTNKRARAEKLGVKSATLTDGMDLLVAAEVSMSQQAQMLRELTMLLQNTSPRRSKDATFLDGSGSPIIIIAKGQGCDKGGKTK